jgi:hypothetical protein
MDLLALVMGLHQNGCINYDLLVALLFVATFYGFLLPASCALVLCVTPCRIEKVL